MDLLRALLTAGLVDLTPTEHPVPLLTRQGAEVMRAQGPVRVAIPLEREKRVRKRAAGTSGRTGGPELESVDGATRDRFERLRAHRALVAKAKGVPAYVVALDRTLLELATRAPRTLQELLGVYGMGPARVETYGDGFLRVLSE